MKTWIPVSIAVAAVLVVGLLLVSTANYSAQTSTTTQSSSGSTTPNTVVFTIIESDRGPMEGMNGSFYHLSESWPVIQVQLGDIVIIHIISENSSEPHGFTIVHYFDPGVALLPGGTYTLKFVASEQGIFLVTCLIYCLIHPFMDHGELVVEA